MTRTRSKPLLLRSRLSIDRAVASLLSNDQQWGNVIRKALFLTATISSLWIPQNVLSETCRTQEIFSNTSHDFRLEMQSKNVVTETEVGDRKHLGAHYSLVSIDKKTKQKTEIWNHQFFMEFRDGTFFKPRYFKLFELSENKLVLSYLRTDNVFLALVDTTVAASPAPNRRDMKQIKLDKNRSILNVSSLFEARTGIRPNVRGSHSKTSAIKLNGSSEFELTLVFSNPLAPNGGEAVEYRVSGELGSRECELLGSDQELASLIAASITRSEIPWAAVDKNPSFGKLLRDAFESH